MPSGLIAATTVVVLLAVGARLIQKSWAAPGPYFALWSCFTVLLPLSAPLFGAPIYDVWPGAIWWIALGTLMFALGAFFGGGGIPSPVVLKKRRMDALYFCGIAPLIAVCIVASLVYVFLYTRLDDPVNPPMSWQAVLPFHYGGPVLGGMLFGSDSSRRGRVIALLTLLPGTIAGTLIWAGRTAIVLSFMYWSAGYFATLVLLRRKPVALATKGHVIAGIATILAFALSAVVLTSFRHVLDLSMNLGERVTAYRNILSWEMLYDDWTWLQPSFFGGTASFSLWFEEAWAHPPVPEFGRYTLAGILRWLGVNMSQADYVVLDGIGTNAFIVFKPMISDYGLWGSLVAWFLYGSAAGWAYKKVSEGKLWPIAILCQIYTNAAVGGGFFFAYNSLTAVFVLLGIYLSYAEKQLSRLSWQEAARWSRLLVRRTESARLPSSRPWRIRGATRST